MLSQLTRHYLDSHDYNGLSVRVLANRFGSARTRRVVETLVRSGFIGVELGDRHPNPHIHALPYSSRDEQLAKLGSQQYEHACLYLSPKHLAQVVDRSRYEGKPYTQRLALGEPQLAFVNFDLSVLEFYRNDPRYYYVFDDVSGIISIKDKYYGANAMPEHDRALLQSFGVSLDSELKIYVAAFLRYLDDLTPEHQKIWAAKQIPDDVEIKLHPNYYTSSIVGNFPEKLSLHQAVLLELKTINELAASIGRPSFFRKDFHQARPREFGYLLRPTSREFGAFVHLLDKMLADNINQQFFGDDIPLETESERSDGKIVVTKKNTIQLLEDWLRSEFKTNDWSEIEEILRTLRKIRSLRQRPAHAIDEDRFDQEYVRRQQDLMKSVYRAVKVIRMVLACHPRASSVVIDRHLEEGLIWQI